MNTLREREHDAPVVWGLHPGTSINAAADDRRYAFQGLHFLTGALD